MNYFVSPPKVGTTWVLHMLMSYQILREGKELKGCLRAKKGFGWQLKKDNGDYLFKLLSNDIANWVRPDPEIDFKNDDKLVFMVRGIKDTLVSTYFHVTAERQFKPFKPAPYSGTISEMMRNPKFGIKRLIDFYNKWDNKLSDINNIFLVYEEVKKDPYTTLKKLIKFLDIPYNEEYIKEAVDFSSFENMQKQEKEYRNTIGKSLDTDKFRARRGEIGSYKDYLSKDDINFIDNYIKKYSKSSLVY